MIKLIVMKTILRFWLYLILLILFKISIFCHHCYGQDLLMLKTEEEIDVKILNVTRHYITCYHWDDLGGEIHEINRKFIKWYRPETWLNQRFSFSFTFGGVPYGTSTSLKKFMREHGYSGNVPSWFGGSIKYPKSAVKISWMLEFEYMFNPPHGLSIAYARSNTGSVRGLGTGTISYENPQVLIYYKHYSKSFKSNIQAGILLNFCSFSYNDYNSFNEIDKSKSTIGIIVGFTGSIIERRVFFWRFQTQFKYVPPIKFSYEDGLLANEKIGLSSLFLGMQLGIKLYPDKN